MTIIIKKNGLPCQLLPESSKPVHSIAADCKTRKDDYINIRMFTIIIVNVKTVQVS